MPKGLFLTTEGSSLSKIEAPVRILYDVRGKRTLLEGLKEGGDKVRTKVRRALRVQMGIKNYGTIIDHTPGGLSREEDFTYAISGMGGGLPIKNYLGLKVAKLPPQPRDTRGRFTHRPEGMGAISARPWGILHQFKRSYLSQYGTPMARRPDGERHRLYGPSPAKEIVKGKALETFQRNGVIDVRSALEKRLLRVFG